MRPAAIAFPALLQDFFLRRLAAERGASDRTVESYRDAFELLLRFLHARLGRPPSALTLADLDAPAVLAFLDHLEKVRHNSPRSRNLRLTAIRTFFLYASLRVPSCAAIAQRILAIPTKRFDRPALTYLTRDEVRAVTEAPDASTWSGRRDVVMLATMYNTGARVSEIAGLRVADVLLDRRSAVHLHGKGRKERVVPLWPRTAARLRAWIQTADRGPCAPVFPNRSGHAMSRSGIEQRLRAAVARAVLACPTLASRKISPHTLRHTTAMHLLQAGVDITVIAAWLGHTSTATTHIYVEADLEMKEAALRRLHEPSSGPLRYRPGDPLLAFLESL